MLALGLAGTHAPAVYVAVAAWGVAFGGSPTLLQTASAEAAGRGGCGAIDPGHGLDVAIAGGGIVGGLLLDASGAGALPWAALGLALAAAAGRNGARPWLSGGTAPRPASVKAAGIRRTPAAGTGRRARQAIDVPQARGLPPRPRSLHALASGPGIGAV